MTISSSPRYWRWFQSPWVLCGIGLIWMVAGLTIHRTYWFGDGFLLADESYSLFLNDQILNGKRLYRDIFYQYGPLTAWTQATAAFLFGNTAFVHLSLLGLLTLINLGQLGLLFRRYIKPTLTSTLFLYLVFLPAFVIPSVPFGNIVGPSYNGLERLMLLSALLLWRPMNERTWARSLTCGLVIGSIQFVKFGGAFVMAAAWVSADLIHGLGSRKGFRQAFRSGVALASGFGIMELTRVGAAFAFLPRSIAIDFIWPSFMVTAYKSYIQPANKYVHWQNRGYFVGVQLPAAIAAVLCMGAFAVMLRRLRCAVEKTSANQSIFILPGFYFAIALLIYLPQAWIANSYVWTLLFASMLPFEALPRMLRFATLSACLPVFWHAVQQTFLPAQGMTIPASVFKGEKLWLPPETRLSLELLEKEMSVSSRQDSKNQVLIFPLGSGFYHFFGGSPEIRNLWFMPGFTRPYDEPELLKSLDQTTCVALWTSDPLPPGILNKLASWGAINPGFTPTAEKAFEARLGEPKRLTGQLIIFPLNKKTGTK